MQARHGLQSNIYLYIWAKKKNLLNYKCLALCVCISQSKQERKYLGVEEIYTL